MELNTINLIISITKLLIVIGSCQIVGVLMCESKSHKQFDLILTG